MNITVKTKDNQADSFAVRKAVFIDEQGYKNEFDEIDNICDYVTVYCGGKLAGTGRAFPSEFSAELPCSKSSVGCTSGRSFLKSLKKLRRQKAQNVPCCLRSNMP